MNQPQSQSSVLRNSKINKQIRQKVTCPHIRLFQVSKLGLYRGQSELHRSLEFEAIGEGFLEEVACAKEYGRW